MYIQQLELLDGYISKGVEPLYSVYYRRKKNGKFRVITAPAEELKTIQAEFAEYLYNLFESELKTKLHITGFIKDRSIKHNAILHLYQEWVLNIDIKDFFPSITREVLEDVLLTNMKSKNANFKDLSDNEILNLCTYNGALPQGSPCSPIIANLIALWTIDEHIIKLAKHYGFIFSRYADDLTFSCKEEVDREYVQSFANDVCEIIERDQIFKVNPRKVNIKHRSQRQLVTGILVNNIEPKISRPVMNKLRAILHNHKLKEQMIDDKLAGVLGYIKQINTNQFYKLTKDFPCKLLTLNSLNHSSQIQGQRLLDSLN